MSNYLFISDAAKEVKVESHVLRYWEEELHLPIKRNELGHRYYTEEDVERFKQIKGMKERGLQLKAIKMILKDGKLDVLQESAVDSIARAVPAEACGSVGVDEMEDLDGTGRSAAPGINRLERPEASDARMPGGQGMPYARASENGAQDSSRGLAIDIVPGKTKTPEIAQESREDKSRRLQWILQQLIRQAMQENNSQLCREIRESVVKELDYQFRMQEEREEARDRMLAERDEEHYKRMDEVLRKKSRFNKKIKLEKRQEKKLEKKQQKENNRQENAINSEAAGNGQAVAAAKKKRRFI